MTTNKKAKNGHGSGNQSNPNQGNQGNQGNFTKVILSAETKTEVLVTKVLVGVIRGKIPVGENTIHPKGHPTRLAIQRDKTKVQMIMMLIHLTC